MLVETNSLKLHAKVSDKFITGGKNVLILKTSKGMKLKVEGYVYDNLFEGIEKGLIYEIEGYLVPHRKNPKNNIAIHVTKITEAQEYEEKHYIQTTFNISGATNIYTTSDYTVRQINVEFMNKNIKDVKIDVTLWGDLALLEDEKLLAKKAYACSTIALNKRTGKLKLCPYSLVVLN